MAAIQPKNTNQIKVDEVFEKTNAAGIKLKNTTKVDAIVEDTAAAGVSINGAIKVKTTGIEPLTATQDLGNTSSPDTHYREIFAKEVTSNGQDLLIGADSAHEIDFKSNSLIRCSLESDGDFAQNSTNGANLLWTKQSTAIAKAHQNTLTAAGTTISDALDLTGTFCVMTTVASNTGAQLWDAPIGSTIIVVNAGANALLLYPHSGSGTINGGGGGSSVSIATASLALCVRDTANNWIAREIAAPAA